jgi:hypothetical protein
VIHQHNKGTQASLVSSVPPPTKSRKNVPIKSPKVVQRRTRNSETTERRRHLSPHDDNNDNETSEADDVDAIENCVVEPKNLAAAAPEQAPSRPKQLQDRGTQASVTTRTKSIGNDDTDFHKLNKGTQASVTTKNQSIGSETMHTATGSGVDNIENLPPVATQPKNYKAADFGYDGEDTRRSGGGRRFEPQRVQLGPGRNDSGGKKQSVRNVSAPDPADNLDLHPYSNDIETPNYASFHPDEDLDDLDEQLNVYASSLSRNASNANADADGDKPMDAVDTRMTRAERPMPTDYSEKTTSRKPFQPTSKPRTSQVTNRRQVKHHLDLTEQPVNVTYTSYNSSSAHNATGAPVADVTSDVHFGYQGPRSEYVQKLMHGAPQGSITQWEHTEKEEEEIVGQSSARLNDQPLTGDGEEDAMLNFDTVSEKVDLSVSDGLAEMTVKVRCERIVPARGGVPDLFKKTSVIATKVIEVDLTVTDDRRQLYEQILAGQRESATGRLSYTDTFDLYKTFMALAEADEASGRQQSGSVHIDESVDEQKLLDIQLSESAAAVGGTALGSLAANTTGWYFNNGSPNDFRRVDRYLPDVGSSMDVNIRSRSHDRPIESRTLVARKQQL